MNSIAAIALLLLLAKWMTQLWLDHLNRRYVLQHASSVPESFKDFVDEATYAKSIQYTLAKGRVHQIEISWDALLLIALLFTGVLPRVFDGFRAQFADSAWSMAAFLFAVGLTLTLASLPLSWYAQFRLEERFGFNTSTQRLWWLDRVKGFILATVLGYPLLALLLKLMESAGPWWWLWAWGTVVSFQILLALLAPVLILPLFNKLTPLPEGSLREKLLGLARQAGFQTRGLEVMDGSKRSRHSNAFFTGFGRFRKIILFDTLLQQLNESELAAVLAHEIGHFKKRHIPKMLAWSATGLLAGFYALSLLPEWDGFHRAFGFYPGTTTVAFLLFGLLAGVATFWLSPLASFWSRRFEFEADAYAAGIMADARPLITALRKLSEKNLSNLAPHPLYSGFYYSHPTLAERERALNQISAMTDAPVTGAA